MNIDFDRVVDYFTRYPAEALPLLCSFPPFIISFYRLRHFRTEYQTVFIYVWLTCIFEVVNSLMAFQRINNLHLYNLFGIVEGVILLGVYYNFFKPQSRNRKVIFLFGILFLLFGCWNITLGQGYRTIMNSFTYLCSAFFLLITVLLYFTQMLQNPEVISLRYQPKFWFSVGALLYFSGSFFVFMFAELVVNGKKDLGYFDLWSIYSVMAGVFRVGIYYSLKVLRA